LAEAFELRKKGLALKLGEHQKKSSTVEKAFKQVDKRELYLKRKEMMKYPKTAEKLNLTSTTTNSGFNATPVPGDKFSSYSPIPRDADTSQLSFVGLSKASTPLNMSKIEKRAKEPNPELLERLALGVKTKMSKKEMYELTNKRYEALPEVRKKREEERKREEYLASLKKRQEKVKQLDEVLLSYDFINLLEIEKGSQRQEKINTNKVYTS